MVAPFTEGTITTAICVEVLSSSTTNFASSVCTCSAVKVFVKSFTSLGGLGLSGYVCPNTITEQNSIKTVKEIFIKRFI